ncbi:hypothetical protein CEXT_532811 [Caerostris extrusa]|uniref:Uncharacterized protein n=1 Tax=Caerostris extrusa TaxID=172846 RepID=A0AAV4XHK5_CAEEX|nr:hypothetical protein CEXT_532811 [Caerostris extrusa]
MSGPRGNEPVILTRTPDVTAFLFHTTATLLGEQTSCKYAAHSNSTSKSTWQRNCHYLYIGEWQQGKQTFEMQRKELNCCSVCKFKVNLSLDMELPEILRIDLSLVSL